ncbi:MAG: hypothetical protein ABWY29_00685 [Blastococcus sp.]
MDLDDVVPVPDHVTHQARVIDAPRRAVWDELHRVKLRSMPVSFVLSAIRAMPVLLTGRWRNGGVDATFLDLVPIPLLSSEPPTAVVFGGVLQAWRLSGGQSPPELDAHGVREFAEPGWVKIGMEFRLTPAVGGTHLSSETRVAATDPTTRRRFDRYWFVVGPGSSAIRWELLTAVATRAEARAGR